MQTVTGGKTEPTSSTEAPQLSRERLSVVWHRVSRWLSERLALRDAARLPNFRHVQLAIACSTIFLLALGVRLLHWQDSYLEIAQKGPRMSGIARLYENEARRMLDEGGILFPNNPVDPGDARLVLHPPGYSALMAGIFAWSGNSDSTVRLAQIIFDALSAVMVFLIAAQLFPSPAAIMAAMLAALSPHFAHYSLWISPDTLPILPILVAVYLIIKASKRPRLVTIIIAGAMVGSSCWLRANALLLAPFLAAAVFLLFERSKRLRYSAALICATIIVISPITIRNWILFHRLIPVSVDAGLALVEGIAAYDDEGRFAMPRTDGEASKKDVEWHNRPDYGGSLWKPDGIERDEYRFRRGLEVIRANPLWFAGVMIRRAGFMLRYNDSGRADWPFTTSRVPVISAEPPAMHLPANTSGMQPVWSTSSPGLLADGSVLSQQADVSLASDTQSLRITGDASEFGDQFASAPIAVKPKTDYVLTLQVAHDARLAAAKVTSSDRRIALASEILNHKEANKKLQKRMNDGDDGAPVDSAAQDPRALTQLEFASGDRSEVRLVISNNGPASARPVTELGDVELFDLGATPYQWTRYPRALIRGLQKNLFRTNAMLPPVIAGVLLVALARRGRTLVVLLAVPAYYLCAQSALTTEYRYILAIHYLLFILAAVTLYCFAALIGQVIRHRWWRGIFSRQHVFARRSER